LHLTRPQEKALRGEEGGARQLSMEILTKVGEALDANSLVPIKSAHVLAHYSSLHEAGVEMLEKFATEGGKFSVPTTVDPASMDLENWKTFGIPEEYAAKQLRLCAAYNKMGGIPCWSCVQYQVCNFPKAGETVAWAESSSVVFANSLMGCRTNKITSGLDLACALMGVTPNYGMLLDENRVAQVAFRSQKGELSDLDFRSLGFYIGRNAGSKVPALAGLPKYATSDQLKHLGAGAAAAGPVTMIHYVGITPGSPTMKASARGESVETIEVSGRDLKEVEDDLNQTEEAPDLVALGVPHLSVSELGETAKALKGRKVRRGVKMYVYTSRQAYDMATRSGIRRDLEAAGARLTHSTDAEISPLRRLGFRVVMTNSAKLAEIVSSEGEVLLRYRKFKDIVEEVTA
jgi:predicted aconitase